MSLLYLKDVLSTLTAKNLVLESHEHQVKQFFHAAQAYTCYACEHVGLNVFTDCQAHLD